MKHYLVLLLAAVAASQSLAAETPAEAATEYWKQLEAGKFENLSEMFAPEAITKFREMLSFYKEMPEDEADHFCKTLFGVDATAESVGKMTDKEFFNGFMTTVFAQIAGTVQFTEFKVIGAVAEGKDVSHVLLRAKVEAGELQLEKVEVVSTKKVDGEWKLLLSGDMEGAAVKMRAVFGNQR